MSRTRADIDQDFAVRASLRVWQRTPESRLHGDVAWNPDELTYWLRIIPSVAFKRGETPRNEPLAPFTRTSEAWDHSLWSLESDSHVRSTNLMDDVEWPLQQHYPGKDILRAYISESELEADVLCFLSVQSQVVVRLELDVLERLVELALPIDFDIYGS